MEPGHLLGHQRAAAPTPTHHSAHITHFPAPCCSRIETYPGSPQPHPLLSSAGPMGVLGKSGGRLLRGGPGPPLARLPHPGPGLAFQVIWLPGRAEGRYLCGFREPGHIRDFLGFPGPCEGCSVLSCTVSPLSTLSQACSPPVSQDVEFGLGRRSALPGLDG